MIAVLACAAAALLLVWAAVTGNGRLRVPPAVALVVAIAPAAAAWRLLRMRSPTAGSGDGAAALIFTSFAATGAWIALGSGARVCTSGGRLDPVVQTGLSCRVPFGIGAVLAALLAAYAIARLRRATVSDRSRSS